MPQPRTILEGVRKLPPATVRIVEPDGRTKDILYWSASYERSAEDIAVSREEWRDRVLAAMRTAVERRMVADVPVGVLLSGGVDSSMVVGLLAESGQTGLMTFSIGFEAANNEKGDEFVYSDLIAKHFATDHHKMMIESGRLLDALPGTIGAMSEPMVSYDNVGFYLLSQEVAKHIKVVQSGQGADEVFGGYHWYPPLAASNDVTADYARVFFDRSHERMREHLSPDWLAEGDPSREFVAEHFAQAGATAPVDKALRLDSTVMLVDDPVKRVDNMTMAWGLEARVPFLDHELVELAARIPAEHKLADGGKGVLKDAARMVVPSEVIDRKKGYFPVPALKYLSGPYLEMVRDALGSQAARERGLFRPEYLDALFDAPEEHITPLQGLRALAGWTARDVASGKRDLNDMARQGTRQDVSANRRLKQRHELEAPPPIPPDEGDDGEMRRNYALDCGWGRLLFAQTFDDAKALADATRAEGPDRRDIALYVRDPHVALAAAPQELFLDPSHTYRLDLSIYRPASEQSRGFSIRRLTSIEDADAINRIYQARSMVPVPPDFFWSKRDARAITYFVAEDDATGTVVGTVTGVDHFRAFDDPEHGSSLWCLAVDPQAAQPGIGEALVRRLAEHFKARGSAYLDLSVLYDNKQAIALYEKLGFARVPLFVLKRRNPINEKLFTGPAVAEKLNPYATIIVNEARRRGIAVSVTDAEGGFFRLTYGGRSILCRESLSEFTSGVAMSICDDKAVTRRVVSAAGVVVPDQMEAGDGDVAAFLEKHGSVVVKPARGEQGRGVAVGLDTMESIEAAIATARGLSDRVLIEQCASGEDLRLVVIDKRVVAAAIRRPAQVTGDGTSTVEALIERQSRRRSRATGGESKIPLDAETARCVGGAGFAMQSILPEGKSIAVRKAANLHTGGTIHDVTGEVHGRLVEAAVTAARAIDIPVAGIDLLVPSPRRPEYVFIEANERPGLANHDPQPTAERFVDFLFPLSIPTAVRRAVA